MENSRTLRWRRGLRSVRMEKRAREWGWRLETLRIRDARELRLRILTTKWSEFTAREKRVGTKRFRWRRGLERRQRRRWDLAVHFWTRIWMGDSIWRLRTDISTRRCGIFGGTWVMRSLRSYF